MDMQFDLFIAIAAVAVFSTLLFAEFVGRWFRQRQHNNGVEPAGNIGFVASSSFGLLSLLIAFTFGNTINRFENRRAIVVEEAKAIGTAHAVANFAAEPLRDELQALLLQYARVRLQYGSSDHLPGSDLVEESRKMRKQLEEIGVRAAKTTTSAPIGSALFSSINVVIGEGQEREATDLARMPKVIRWLLGFYSILFAIVLGYSSHGDARRLRPTNVFLLLALTFAQITILDLDLPSDGTIFPSQAPMRDLIADIE